MLNTTQFAKRLEIILEEYELSAAGFAQKIEVGRASISHILSGRNKPSLDFVLKLIKAFPEVDLYWLLNGKGSFPKSPSSPLSHAETQINTTQENIEFAAKNKVATMRDTEVSQKTIDKIVIFYSDGSFEPYHS